MLAVGQILAGCKHAAILHVFTWKVLASSTEPQGENAADLLFLKNVKLKTNGIDVHISSYSK